MSSIYRNVLVNDNNFYCKQHKKEKNLFKLIRTLLHLFFKHMMIKFLLSFSFCCCCIHSTRDKWKLVIFFPFTSKYRYVIFQYVLNLFVWHFLYILFTKYIKMNVFLTCFCDQILIFNVNQFSFIAYSMMYMFSLYNKQFFWHFFCF